MKKKDLVILIIVVIMLILSIVIYANSFDKKARNTNINKINIYNEDKDRTTQNKEITNSVYNKNNKSIKDQETTILNNSTIEFNTNE